MKFLNELKIICLLFVLVLLTNCTKEKDELVMQLISSSGVISIIAPTDIGNYRIDASGESSSSSAFFQITEDISNRVQDENFVVDNQVVVSDPVDIDPTPVGISDPVSSIVIEFNLYLPGEEMSVFIPENNSTLSVYKL